MKGGMETGWPVPDSWTWTTAGDIAEVVGGGTPRTTEAGNFERGSVPWITPADLSGYRGKYVSRGSRNITERGLATSGARLMPAGSVLFSSRAPVGYVAIANVPVSTSQGFKSLVVPSQISSEYLYYYLQRAKEMAVGLASGTTFLEISGAQMAKLPVTLPPLPEQHRIVEAIESYFSRLDEAVALLERVKRNLKRYRASVLKAAVEGRLVPTEAALARAEGRAYEPASTLLERILAERRRRFAAEGRRGPYKEPAAPDTSQLPPLPEGWCWATVEQLSDETRPVTYGVIKLGAVVPDGVPTLRSSNVRHLCVDLEYAKPISRGISRTHWRTVLRGGEVLVTVRGTLGGVALVPPTCRGYNISREVAMIAPVEKAVSPILSTFLGSPSLQSWLLRRAKGIAYTGINIETLKELPIPLPPLAEMPRIVDAADRNLSTEGAVSDSLRAQLARLARLRQAILKWAFEGKLADQDPNDEPAAVLLERIRAARAAEGAAGPGRRGRRRRAEGAGAEKESR